MIALIPDPDVTSRILDHLGVATGAPPDDVACELAIDLAYASSLRSADLSRQVGAVVWKESVGVGATG